MCKNSTNGAHSLSNFCEAMMAEGSEAFSCSFCRKSFKSLFSKKRHEQEVHTLDNVLPCWPCNKFFSHASKLEEHKKRPSHRQKAQEYVSKQSVEDQQGRSGLRRHYQCELCDKFFLSSRELKEHKLSVHDKSKSAQAISVKREPDTGAFDLPSVKDKEKKPLICEYCKACFEEVNDLTKHLIKHSMNASSQGQEVLASAEHNNILSPSSGNEPASNFQCDVCDKTFRTMRYLKRHKTSLNHRVNESSILEGAVAIDSNLVIEGNEITEDEEVVRSPHYCDLCEKSFRRSDILKKHKTCNSHQAREEAELASIVGQKDFSESESVEGLSHLDEFVTGSPSKGNDEQKPFICDLCQMSFSSSRTLTKHIKKSKTHKAKKQALKSEAIAQIEEKSDSSSAQSAQPDEKEDPIKCDLCQLSFRKPKHLKQHMSTLKHKAKEDETRQDNTVSAEQISQFECGLCEKAFRNLGALQKHMSFSRSHKAKEEALDAAVPDEEHEEVHAADEGGEDEQDPNRCDLCEKSFKKPSELKRHQSTSYHKANEEAIKVSCESVLINDNVVIDASKSKKEATSNAIEDDNKSSTEDFTDQAKSNRCTLCEVEFATHNSLKRHLAYSIVHKRKALGSQAHNGDMELQAFKCELCEVSFSREDTLANHKQSRTHQAKQADEKANAAKRKCDSTLAKDSLTQRSKKRKVAKPASLDSDKSAAVDGNTVNDPSPHSSISGKELHKCDICDIIFKRPDHFKRHIKSLSHLHKKKVHEQMLKEQCQLDLFAKQQMASDVTLNTVDDFPEEDTKNNIEKELKMAHNKQVLMENGSELSEDLNMGMEDNFSADDFVATSQEQPQAAIIIRGEDTEGAEGHIKMETEEYIPQEIMEDHDSTVSNNYIWDGFQGHNAIEAAIEHDQLAVHREDSTKDIIEDMLEAFDTGAGDAATRSDTVDTNNDAIKAGVTPDQNISEYDMMDTLDPLDRTSMDNCSKGTFGIFAQESMEDLMDEPGSPIQDEPGSPIQDEPGSPIQDEPGSPIQDEPGSPIQDEPGSPIQDEPGSPIQDEPGSPIQDEPGSPIQDEPGSPIQDEPGSPIQDEPGSPIQDEPGSPIQDEPASPSQGGRSPIWDKISKPFEALGMVPSDDNNYPGDPQEETGKETSPPKDCSETPQLKLYKCEPCNLDFWFKFSLTAHEKSPSHFEKLNQQDFMCEKCSARFKNKRELLKHLSIHEQDQDECNICGVCNATFSSLDSLQSHYSQKHICKQCVNDVKKCTCGKKVVVIRLKLS